MNRMLITLLAGILVSAGVWAQSGNRRNPAADWPMFNRDLAGTRYSPLTQINTTNVGQSAARTTVEKQIIEMRAVPRTDDFRMKFLSTVC